MRLLPLLDYSNTYTNGTQTNGQVYIKITDADTGQLVNGNNIEVRFRQDTNGEAINRIEIISGQYKPIYTGLLNDTDPLNLRYVHFTITGYTESTGPPLGSDALCDLSIISITINKSETSPGANDGQITANASSSYGGIEYSLDNTNYQPSPIFGGLSGGVKTVYIRDASGCHAQLSVQLNTLSSLLLSAPTATLPDGNISRWNAAFNPVVFTYQRKDFGVIAATLDTEKGYTILRVNAVLNPDASNPVLKKDDLVYVNAEPYIGPYEVEKVTGTAYITIRTPFAGDAGGFININQMRAYYKVLTRINYQDKQTGMAKTITSTNRPDNTGLIKADISNFLQSLLQATDNSNYTQSNYRDDNLSASYQIAYTEEWDETGETKTSPFIQIDHNFYVLYAAKQLGERYSGNMAAYIPFATLAEGLEKARWISDFAEPAYSNGYPFDIGFIYSEDLLGRDVYCEFTLLDINRNPLTGGAQTSYLLNEDSSWLLNTDGSKLIISRQSTGTIPVPQQLGLNRLLIDTLFANDVYYINIALKYADENMVQTVTQTQTIRVDDAVDDNSVYLRWIGLSGSWNYYRFVFNQEVNLDVQNAVIIKNYVSDWENQQGIEEVISKTAGQKIKVMAEDLSVADIRGLQSIKYSPKVQMLVNKNPVKWQTIVINTATYSEYETRNGRAPFSVTFNMPAINIQTQ
ncbi:hypothetical protein [Mucilaginibacter gilvus]|uniref:Uncharacterized protein n=1 Tax=Mucilaginibacter gilvus TaxID=2305909 RepID=A0A444MNA7_9SPHI|nr:hypothetical protein [Mucilaginibacter gilvus]RWY51189.1 hypothetical protein EPL05_14080 [Mucilaginibacter gilvus]